MCRALGVVYAAAHLCPVAAPGFNSLIISARRRGSGFWWHQDQVPQQKAQTTLAPRQAVATLILYEKAQADSGADCVRWKPVQNWEDSGLERKLGAARTLPTTDALVHLQREGLQPHAKHAVHHTPGAPPRTGARIVVTARIAKLDAWESVDVPAVRDMPAIGPEGDVTLPLVWGCVKLKGRWLRHCDGDNNRTRLDGQELIFSRHRHSVGEKEGALFALVVLGCRREDVLGHARDQSELRHAPDLVGHEDDPTADQTRLRRAAHALREQRHGHGQSVERHQRANGPRVAEGEERPLEDRVQDVDAERRADPRPQFCQRGVHEGVRREERPAAGRQAPGQAEGDCGRDARFSRDCREDDARPLLRSSQRARRQRLRSCTRAHPQRAQTAETTRWLFDGRPAPLKKPPPPPLRAPHQPQFWKTTSRRWAGTPEEPAERRGKA